MNKKEQFGCKKNSQRISFSKDFKRKVLIELSKGKKAKEIITQAVSNILEIDTNDKKYYSKLIYKWKQELYNNNSLLAFTSINPTIDNLNYEINNIGLDEETDDIEEEFVQKNSLDKDIKSDDWL